jgi:hypothetical protein
MDVLIIGRKFVVIKNYIFLIKIINHNYKWKKCEIINDKIIYFIFIKIYFIKIYCLTINLIQKSNQNLKYLLFLNIKFS